MADIKKSFKLFIPFLALITVLLVLYLGNGGSRETGDTLPARQIPVSLLQNGNLYVDAFIGRYKQPSMHSIVNVNGHWVSNYPIGTPLLAVPFYLPLIRTDQISDSQLITFGKISASCLVVIACLILYLTLRRLTSPSNALLIAFIYGLCTSNFSVCSQGLWQHTGSQVAFCAALYCFVRGKSEPLWIALAGLPVCFLVICRPTNVFLALPLTVYVLVQYPRLFLKFIIAGSPVALFHMWYNLHYFGEVFHSQFPFRSNYWDTPFLDGFSGLLISPGRGLFIFSPILLFSILGLWRIFRSPSDPIRTMLLYTLCGTLLVIFLHSKWCSWWGGLSYGPRLISDLLPGMCLALYPAADIVRNKIWLKLCAIIFIGISFEAHFVGAYGDQNQWKGYFEPEGLWLWTDNPSLVNPARAILDAWWIRFRDLPTSQSHPEYLNARYTFPKSDKQELYWGKGDQLRLILETTNAGQAVWLARTPGAVSLRCILKSKGSNGLPLRQVKVPLRHVVYPGSTYWFPIRVMLPNETGSYTLQVGLVKDDVAFERSGVPELRIPIRVKQQSFQHVVPVPLD